ncbi:MAG: NUDIX hydrolase [Desulfomonilaceae bacterium]
MSGVVREYPPAPLVGVGGLVLDRGKVLLVKRAKEPSRGEWSIPGGLVELGETLHQAVVREVHEETGLIVTPQALLKLVERIIPDETGAIVYHYILADYLCAVAGGEEKAGSDALDCAWVCEADLARYRLAPVTAELVQEVLAGCREGDRSLKV